MMMLTTVSTESIVNAEAPINTPATDGTGATVAGARGGDRQQGFGCKCQPRSYGLDDGFTDDLLAGERVNRIWRTRRAISLLRIGMRRQLQLCCEIVLGAGFSHLTGFLLATAFLSMGICSLRRPLSHPIYC